MLQRSKSLPHVVEFAECRVEPVRIRGIYGFILRIVLAAATEAHDDQNGDKAESNECGNDGDHDCAC